MLDTAGGAGRIADYATARRQTVDASAVHAVKSRIFRQKLLSAPLTARPGVVDTIRAGRRRGDKVGFVTTTSPDTSTRCSTPSARRSAGPTSK